MQRETRWAKHGRLRGAYLSFSGVTCRAAEVFDDVTPVVAGEYNTACRDALASRARDFYSPTSRNYPFEGEAERLVDRNKDGDKNGRQYLSLL